MNDELIKAYESIFKNFRLVNNDEYVAKESIQMTMLKLLSIKDDKLSIRRPRNFIINSSRFYSKDIMRGSRAKGKSSTYYESEAGERISEDDGQTISEYISKIESTDFGQIFSFEDQYDIDVIKNRLGEDFNFMVDHIDFSTGERLRGAKQESHRPKVFDSDKDRYKMAYIRKRVKKMFKNGYTY